MHCTKYLGKMRWLMAARSDRFCTHTHTHTDTRLHPLEVVVDRGAPVSALDVDHGRHSYSNRVTQRPSLNSPQQCHTVLPSPRSFMLFSLQYVTSLLTQALLDTTRLSLPSELLIG